MFHWFLYQSTRVPPDSYKPLLILTNSHNLPNKVLHGIPTVSRRARGPQKNLSEFSCSVGKISQSFLVLPEKSLRVSFFCQENAFPQFRFSSKTKSLKISGNWKCANVSQIWKPPTGFGGNNFRPEISQSFYFWEKTDRRKISEKFSSITEGQNPASGSRLFLITRTRFSYHFPACKTIKTALTRNKQNCGRPLRPWRCTELRVLAMPLFQNANVFTHVSCRASKSTYNSNIIRNSESFSICHNMMNQKQLTNISKHIFITRKPAIRSLQFAASHGLLHGKTQWVRLGLHAPPEITQFPSNIPSTINLVAIGSEKEGRRLWTYNKLECLLGKLTGKKSLKISVWFCC